MVCGCRACLLPVGNMRGYTAAVVCAWQIPALPWYGVSPGLVWCCMEDNAYLVGYRYLLLVIISAADGAGYTCIAPLAVFSRYWPYISLICPPLSLQRKVNIHPSAYGFAALKRCRGLLGSAVIRQITPQPVRIAALLGVMFVLRLLSYRFF